MPVRRGHVAPRTTLIETIIRKFDTDSKYTISIELILHGADVNVFEWSMRSTAPARGKHMLKGNERNCGRNVPRPPTQRFLEFRAISHRLPTPNA